MGETRKPVWIATGLGALLLWLAMEPLAWWPLGWVALVPWSLLALMAAPPNAREYRWLWYAGSAFWLVSLYGLCFAHPAMFLGWIALSLYLGAYTPLFVALVRVAVRNRIAAVIAVPSVWVGLELIRGYAFTGFSACLLGHTQADVPIVIQVADLFGSYAVSAVLATVAAVIAMALARRFTMSSASSPSAGKRATIQLALSASASILLVAATLGYGAWRLKQPEASEQAASLGVTIALIQRNEPVEYIMPAAREAEIFDSYLRGSLKAMTEADPEHVDLVVWPESMFTRGLPWMMMGDSPQVPEEVAMSSSEFENRIAANAEIWQQNAGAVQRRLALAGSQSTPPALLLGSAVLRIEERTHSYSGAVFVSPQGRVTDWYGKQHLVMFGEYIPFVEWYPSLYRQIPMPRVTPGPEPKTIRMGETTIAPNICFETAVESATINQVRALTAAGSPPEMIINMTNDAWFGGSPILDHHRRCSQFVAVSTRRPLLMASNTGPTLWADGSGRLVRQLPIISDGHILARPTRDSRWGLYQVLGDWPVRLLGLAVVLLAFTGWRQRRRERLAV